MVTFVGQAGVAATNILIAHAAVNGNALVIGWNSTAGATYSVLKTNVLAGSATNWPAIVTGYPAGGAAGGSLSATDTTAGATLNFYRVRSP